MSVKCGLYVYRKINCYRNVQCKEKFQTFIITEINEKNPIYSNPENQNYNEYVIIDMIKILMQLY